MNDRRHYSAPRVREFLLPPTLSAHGQGFVACGMSMRPPSDPEMNIGYADHRDNFVSTLTAMDGEVLA